MNVLILVMVASIILQLIATFLALQLIRTTGRVAAWALVAGAVILMTVRRTITFYHVLLGHVAASVSLDAELVGLAISALLVAGLFVARSIFADVEHVKQQAVQSEGALRSMLENVDLVGVALDADGKVTFCNEHLLSLSGRSEGEVLGADWFDLFIPEGEREEVRSMFFEAGRGGEMPVHHENYILTRDGRLRLIKWNNTVLTGADGAVVGTASIGEDITEKQEARARIDYLAYFDPLTGLTNRDSFTERLRQALIHAQSKGELLAFLFVDIDRFKMLNDTLGYSVGDDILRAAAARLREVTGAQSVVGRLGADDFGVLLPEISDAKESADLAQMIRMHFSGSWQLGERSYHVSASIGISIYPHDGNDPEAVMRNAEAACRRGRELGGNNYQFYAADMNASTTERLLLENGLRRALDNDEFVLRYQPIVRSGDSAIVGAEALLRWQHPELGLLGPEGLIPILDETGLIVPVGKWVLRTACAQNQLCRAKGWESFRISVNLSARQFQEGDMVEVVEGILKETGMPARNLALELTESAIMEKPERVIEALIELRELGIEISVDDFGTGYSSLGYLRRFPIDQLKIDSSFIRDVARDMEDAAIVRAVVALGHNLKMSVVAEGVETREQLYFLEAIGCDMVQGFLFAKPLTPEELMARLVGNGRMSADGMAA